MVPPSTPPIEYFHGRILFNTPDIKFGNPPNDPHNTTDVNGILDHTNERFQETHANIIEAFYKYKNYYDRKAQASRSQGFYFQQKFNKHLR